MLRPRHRLRRFTGRDDAVVLTGVGLAAVSTFLAEPLLALLWAVLATVGGVAFLVQDRPGRPVAIAALLAAGVGLMWAVGRLGVPT